MAGSRHTLKLRRSRLIGVERKEKRIMKILLIEDDIEISEMLCSYLIAENFEVVCAADGQKACEAFDIGSYSIVLLDLMIPQISGMNVMKYIRQKSTVPIIIISAKDSDSDKTLGLGLGADDYITKPFSVEELLARIRVTQRRLAITQTGEQQETSVFKNGELEIDYSAGCAYLKGEELHLTPIEYKLLCLLSRNVGKVLTHTYITQQIWGRCSENDVASLRVFMATLRKKLEPEKNGVQYIQTHIGIGYRMLRIEKPEQETKKDSINPQTII